MNPAYVPLIRDLPHGAVYAYVWVNPTIRARMYPAAWAAVRRDLIERVATEPTDPPTRGPVNVELVSADAVEAAWAEHGNPMGVAPLPGVEMLVAYRLPVREEAASTPTP